MFASLPFAPGGPHGIDPLLLFAAALIVEAIFGGFPVLFRLLPHPRALIERAVAVLNHKLNREQRSEPTRAWRGVLALALVAGLALAAGLAIGLLARNHPFGWLVEFPLVVALIAQRDAFDRTRALAEALDQNLEAARRALESFDGKFAGGSAAALDFPDVAGAGIERLAQSFAVKVVAPAFGYVLFGAAGLFVVAAVAVMAQAVGHPTSNEAAGRHRAFGRAAARADAAINFIPARFAGLFLVLAAPLARRARATFMGALASMLRDAIRYSRPNLGWPVAAMKGALGLADGTPPDARDLRRAVRLYAAACVLNGAFVVILALAR
jgi:adenosylcobinamide-phosphate synthase